jgi:hypothetical protein
VSAADAAGNTSPDATATYVLDTTAPATPVIVAAPTSGGAPRLVEWSFTIDEGTPACTVVAPDGRLVTGAGCASGTATYDLTTWPDASYRFDVTATDAAGNTSATASSAITVTTPPVVPTPEPPAPEPTPEPPVPTPTPDPPAPEPVAPAVATTPDAPLAAAAPPTSVPAPVPAVPATVVETPTAGAPEPAAPASAPRNARRAPPATPRPTSATPATVEHPTTATDAPTETPPAASDDAGLAAPKRAHTSAATADIGAHEPLADTVRHVAAEVAKRSTIPITLLVIVVLFLLVQDRLDRNDPKLALAPVYPDPELSFGPNPFAGPFPSAVTFEGNHER